MNDAPRPSGSEQPNRGLDIERLLALLGQASEGSRELDCLVYFAFAPAGIDLVIPPVAQWSEKATEWSRCQPDMKISVADWRGLPDFTTSLDDALTLVPLGHSFVVHGPWPPRGYFAGVGNDGPNAWDRTDQLGRTPALALCVALVANAKAPKSVPSLSPTPARGASSPESSLPESNNQSETP